MYIGLMQYYSQSFELLQYPILLVSLSYSTMLPYILLVYKRRLTPQQFNPQLSSLALSAFQKPARLHTRYIFCDSW